MSLPVDFPTAGPVDIGQSVLAEQGVTRDYPLPKKFRNLPYPILTENTKMRLTKKSGELVGEVDAHIDSYGRRLTYADRKSYDRFMIFLGCSYTFGTMVHDDETLPSQVAKNLRDVHVYNYGVQGASPGDMLYRLKSITADGLEISEKQGLVVYVLMSGHYSRTVGPMSFVGTWGARKIHYYENAAHDIVWDGSFEQAWPIKTKLFWFFARSHIVQLLGLNYPWWIGDNDIHFMGRIFEQMQHEAQRLGGRQLVVVFFPELNPAHPLLMAELDRLNIPYIDMAQKSIQELVPEAEIPYDGHPSKYSYNFVAKAISKTLKKLE